MEILHVLKTLRNAPRWCHYAHGVYQERKDTGLCGILYRLLVLRFFRDISLTTDKEICINAVLLRKSIVEFVVMGLRRRWVSSM